jgi:DNA-binding transcriptional LysR family regulator
MIQKACPELNLRELRVLRFLLQERSITQTALLLETTQPAISKTLKRLREQFSDPLFVRNGHAMEPTPKALEMATRLRTLFEAADELRGDAPVFDPRTSDRLFSLLLTDVGMIRFLPPLIARISAMAPGVSVRAVPLGSRQFEMKLEAGEADLALGAFPQAAGHLRRQRLYFDGYLSVMRKRHPRLLKSQSRAGFLAQRHIVIMASETGHAAHGAAQRALVSEIAPSNILLRVPSFIAGAIVASQTNGVATLPANLANIIAGPLGLVAFKTPIALPRIEIAQYWHERYHRDPAHRWIRSLTFELFARNNGGR